LIDERDSIEEDALVQYYFVLNQFAKARASLEASPTYGNRFAILVNLLFEKPFASLIFLARLLQQIKRKQSRVIEDNAFLEGFIFIN
jgi:hypothetical protein